jgi:hypothetical protein
MSMYIEKYPWMPIDDGRGWPHSVPVRPIHPSPSHLKMTAPFPSYLRTDSVWPSRPNLSNFGQMGRLRTLNGAISWQSRKEGLIAMWTLEAEFIACLKASWDAQWLLQLQKDIHCSQKDSPPLPINYDNQGAFTLITTGIIKAETKHIEVCYHNSRDLHKQRIDIYSYVHRNKNVADILLKALTNDQHYMFMKAMGLW